MGLIPGLERSPGGGHGNPSSILAWKIPWTEEPGRLWPIGSQRTGHNCGNLACLHTHQRLQALSTNGHPSGAHSPSTEAQMMGAGASIYQPGGTVPSLSPTKQTLAMRSRKFGADCCRVSLVLMASQVGLVFILLNTCLHRYQFESLIIYSFICLDLYLVTVKRPE